MAKLEEPNIDLSTLVQVSHDDCETIDDFETISEGAKTSCPDDK